MDEIILIDKPAGMTSFGVVARLRRVLSEQAMHQESKRGVEETNPLHPSRDAGKPSVAPYKRQRIKVGHTGTLDPFATGLMIVVTGKKCREAGTYTKLDKWYEAEIVLGCTSSTGDPEGELLAVSDRQPDCQEIEAALEQFRGIISQTPPIFSAIKIDGKRAYDLARAGKAPEMPLRQVEIYTLELVAYKYPSVTIRTHVSSGTYIRTLASDIGQALGTGAYCRELRRTQIANYDVAEARQLADFGISD